MDEFRPAWAVVVGGKRPLMGIWSMRDWRLTNKDGEASGSRAATTFVRLRVRFTLSELYQQNIYVRMDGSGFSEVLKLVCVAMNLFRVTSNLIVGYVWPPVRKFKVRFVGRPVRSLQESIILSKIPLLGRALII